MAVSKPAIPFSISRRQLLGGAAAAAVMAALGVNVPSAFAEQAADASQANLPTDGTYTASFSGMNDKVEVSVEFAYGKFVAVEVTSNSETPGIGGVLTDLNENPRRAGGISAVEYFPQLIVENNSLAVYCVSGATITSAAILAAVEDCVEQAGGDPKAFQCEVTYEDHADQSADMVVVGGGAGLVAAIAAAQQGKSVVVIEKNGECGGDTLVCGDIYNCPDPDMQASVEMSDSVKETVEKALAMTSDDADKQVALSEMQAAVQEQWDEYKASGAPTCSTPRSGTPCRPGSTATWWPTLSL